MHRSLLIGRALPDKLAVVKTLFVAFALALYSTSAFAEDWTTTDGTKYQNVRIIRVEDDAVTILYKDGGALIFLFKLPPALQQRFDYDPVKAKAAMEDAKQSAKGTARPKEDKAKDKPATPEAPASGGDTKPAPPPPPPAPSN